MSQEIALELLTKREAAEYLKTRSVALLGNDGPTGGLLLKGRFRSLVIGNNALIASNAGVLIDECKIANAPTDDKKQATWTKSRLVGQMTRRAYSRVTGHPESAGINRHVVGDAKALQERK
jgi:hypothetical protein